MGKRNRTWLSAGACAVLAATAWITVAPQAPGHPSSGPRYAQNGDLLLPVDFEGWMFVGSNIGLAYKTELPTMTAEEAKRADVQMFHNIYLNPDAYAQFAAARIFPDRTMLVMDIYEAAERDTKGNVLSKGSYNGKRMGRMAAVKNYNRPDGSATPWAYYILTDPNDPTKLVPSAPAQPDKNCENCHKEHASTDHVWVQFYPVLRKFIQ